MADVDVIPLHGPVFAVELGTPMRVDKGSGGKTAALNNPSTALKRVRQHLPWADGVLTQLVALDPEPDTRQGRTPVIPK